MLQRYSGVSTPDILAWKPEEGLLPFCKYGVESIGPYCYCLKYIILTIVLTAGPLNSFISKRLTLVLILTYVSQFLHMVHPSLVFSLSLSVRGLHFDNHFTCRSVGGHTEEDLPHVAV